MQCSFRFTKFVTASLEGAQVQRSDLRGASFRNAILDGANFQASALTPMRVVDPKSGEEKGMWPADLGGASAIGANFQRVDFSNASLEGAILDECDLSHAQLADCNIQGTRFDRANLDKTRMPSGDEAPVAAG